jgi:hypothetical protein
MLEKIQQYALICTTPLFYVLAPTCFGSSLPSSGSFLDTSELLEIQIEWVAGVADCRGSTGRVTTDYMIYHPFYLYYK